MVNYIKYDRVKVTPTQKTQRNIKLILSDLLIGKFITPEERRLVTYYNNSQRLKNKVKKV
jgi:hypothetical protein